MHFLKHYIKVLLFILRTKYPYSKWQLFDTYTLMMFTSLIVNKVSKRKEVDTKSTKILEYKVYFKDYAEFIYLFEEIFIYKTYDFKPQHGKVTIVDCGSHIGVSILYFKLILPESEIVAFEPNPESFDLLKRNIEANHLTNVTVHNVALREQFGKAQMNFAQSKPTDIQSTISALHVKDTCIWVNCLELSNFIRNSVHILKIDTEGAELEILNDLKRNDKLRLIHNVVVEFHPTLTGIHLPDFLQILTELKLKPEKVTPNHSDVLIYCTSQVQQL